jgi:hypothetical protein
MVYKCGANSKILQQDAQNGRPAKPLQLSLSLLGEWPRLPFTARIERAHSYRARSASKKGTWPLPAHLFSILLIKHRLFPDSPPDCVQQGLWLGRLDEIVHHTLLEHERSSADIRVSSQHDDRYQWKLRPDE